MTKTPPKDQEETKDNPKKILPEHDHPPVKNDKEPEEGPIKPPVGEPKFSGGAPVAPDKSETSSKPQKEPDNTQQAEEPVKETIPESSERGLDPVERQPNAGDFVGSEPEATSESLEFVETPDAGAPSAQETSGETGDMSKLASERLEPTKVKKEASDERSIADEAIKKAKEASKDREEYAKNIDATFERSKDLGDVEYEERKLGPAEQAVQDVLEEAQKRARQSVERAQATVAATALAKLGVEAGLIGDQPAERVALADQRRELEDRLARVMAEMERYDATVPPRPDLDKADTDNLAEVGPDQTVVDRSSSVPPEPTGRFQRKMTPTDMADKIVMAVIKVADENDHDFYTMKKILQTVSKRLGFQWVKHREAKRENTRSADQAPVDPNANLGPYDGSGNKFNIYADSAGMVGDKQISTPQYLIPFGTNKEDNHGRDQGKTGGS